MADKKPSPHRGRLHEITAKIEPEELEWIIANVLFAVDNARKMDGCLVNEYKDHTEYSVSNPGGRVDITEAEYLELVAHHVRVLALADHPSNKERVRPSFHACPNCGKIGQSDHRCPDCPGYLFEDGPQLREIP